MIQAWHLEIDQHDVPEVHLRDRGRQPVVVVVFVSSLSLPVSFDSTTRSSLSFLCGSLYVIFTLVCSEDDD
jgi:hypothetical protein